MRVLYRCLVVGSVILCAATFPLTASARGGHSPLVSLCQSAASLDRTFAKIDDLLQTSGAQRAALEALKKVVRENSENMAQLCVASETPMTFTKKVAIARKRLEVALVGNKEIEPVARKFYDTLTDEQKELVDNLVFWPGL